MEPPSAKEEDATPITLPIEPPIVWSQRGICKSKNGEPLCFIGPQQRDFALHLPHGPDNSNPSPRRLFKRAQAGCPPPPHPIQRSALGADLCIAEELKNKPVPEDLTLTALKRLGQRSNSSQLRSNRSAPTPPRCKKDNERQVPFFTAPITAQDTANFNANSAALSPHRREALESKRCSSIQATEIGFPRKPQCRIGFFVSFCSA